jgi:hypothetical protein
VTIQTEQPSEGWSLGQAILAALPGAIIGSMLLLRGLVDGPTLDGAVFAVIGDAVAHGAVPYRDAWDHKPPGIYLANALAGVALPGSGPWFRAWIVSWTSTIGALLGLSILLTRAGRPWYGIVAASLLALPLFAADHFVLGGGQTESVGLLFSVAGLGLVASSRRVAWLALGGVALGAAILISVQFIPALLAGLVVAVIAREGRVARLIAVGVGSAVVPLVSLAWIGANGALPQMLEQVIAYNRAYLANNQQYRDKGLTWAAGDALFLFPAIVAALARIVSFRRAPLNALEIGATTWFASGVVLLLAQGLIFDHYLTALGPPLVILAAPSLAAALECARRLNHPAVATAILIGVLTAPVILGLAISEASAPAAPPSPAVATRIRQITGSNDPIFVWGNEASLYLDADRPLGSRFVYMFPLTAAGYTTPELVAGIVDAWDTRPPRVIVDATQNPGRVGGYPLDPTTDASAPDAVLDPLRRWVLERYRVVDTVDGWDLYEEKPNT